MTHYGLLNCVGIVHRHGAYIWAEEELFVKEEEQVPMNILTHNQTFETKQVLKIGSKDHVHLRYLKQTKVTSHMIKNVQICTILITGSPFDALVMSRMLLI